MPAAIALAGAAFSVSAGLAAGGILGGLMVAGGALSAIGTITGNKKLSKIGTVLGAVGGVGNLASGLLKETATTAAAEAAKDAAATATAGSTVGDLAGTAGDVASTATDVASEAAKSLNAAATAEPGMLGGGVIGGASPGLAGGPLSAPVDAFTAQANPLAGQLPAGGPAFGSTSLGAQAAPQPGIIQRMFGQGAADTAVGQTAQKWIDGASNAMGQVDAFTKANPTMAKMGAGIIQGAAAYGAQNEANKAAEERAKKYQDWVRQRYSDSVRNLVIPQVTAPLSSGIIGRSTGG